MEENDNEYPLIPSSNKQIYAESLPKLENLEFKGLEKKLLTTNLLSTFIFFGVLFSILLILHLLVDVEFVGKISTYLYLSLLILSILSAVFTYFSFYKKSYALRERDIIFNKGLIWRSTTVIPFNRVQHCEVSHGPIDRMFGLSALKIYTAGGATSDLSIDGLMPSTAHRIKDFIIQKTNLDEEE